ncbi:PilC/PilY family type IV pilus protein [Ideonella sp. DXS29W]|uniref:PilC/PilY family type IV pilus protein n=1 Tax=Ideonella lacteola TaxID=2984193 RepID=A0ABU9BLL2_9BURK
MAHSIARLNGRIQNVSIVAVFAAAVIPTAIWGGEPAQIPLSSRVAEPPIPNVNLTIDDSGSMLADFMPEGSFTVNGKSVTLANGWIAAFPGDWRKLCQDGKKGSCVAGTWPTGGYLDGVVTSIKNPTEVYQMQYRSPDVNAIYYNPDIRYLPWYKPDGTRFPNAKPSAAPYDPVITDATFNLSINYTKPTGADAKISTVWYTKYNSTSNSSQEFYPGYVYRLKSGADPTSKSNFTLYDVNATDGSHAPAEKNANRTDCAGKKCTQVEELQNFANWFTYYRMRESLTKAAVSESFVQFKDKLRVSWGRINNGSSTSIDGSSKKYSIIESESNGGPMRPLDATRLNKVLTGVQKVSSWPSTPLRTALNTVGTYFDRSSDQTGSPWLTDPSSKTNKEKLSCRRSVSLLMTDGYYNDSYSGAGDIDGVSGTDYAGSNPNSYSPTQYKPVRPFIDSPTALSNTLADVAMKFFVTDLDTNLANKVPPLTGDIAYWQHLTQFMVGLGVIGTLDSSTPAQKTATLKAITEGSKNWPDPTKGNPQKIDDMWHAAVNTGGDFYSVRNVTELTAALKDAFGRSAGNEAKEAGVATASGYIVAGNVKYVPKYKSVSWWGDLEAWPLGIDGREGDSVLWRASEHLPAAAKRNLFTWYGSEPGAFVWDSMPSSIQSLVGSKGLTNYIRGDDTDTGYTGTYRSRDGKYLGDFVNSPPVLVKGLLNLGYTAFDSNYTTFVAAKKSRSDGLVFAGANDGMLHAFRSSDGTEVFGYLPKEGLSRLGTIASKDYGTTANYHRFFVDGPINETDAFIRPRGASSAEWSNLLIGSMGAGGRTFFALHIPTSFGSTLDAADLGANTIMWEKSSADDEDIGYMFADFAVGKIKGGGWKAFVGNGVYSKDGKAVLLVVDLEDGDIEQKIVVDSSSGTGLMGVSLIKDETSHEVVGAYAGDLKGNLWRFDIKDGEVVVGFSGEALFRATDKDGHAQPITIPPATVHHPEYGQVVLFGTGRLIDTTDADSSATQTFYGVWDTTKIGESSAAATSPFHGVSRHREKLQVQKASTTPSDTNGKYFDVETEEVDWKSQLGWLMDLPFSRQRVLFPSFVLADTYVFFSTSVPATEAAVCSTSTGVGYNYLLIAANGMTQDTPTYDTNGDGKVDEQDIIAAGFKTGNDGRDAIVMRGNEDEDDGAECEDGFRKYLDCHTGKACEWVRVQCTADNFTVKDRIWKQIVNPPVPAKK